MIERILKIVGLVVALLLVAGGVFVALQVRAFNGSMATSMTSRRARSRGRRTRRRWSGASTWPSRWARAPAPTATATIWPVAAR